MILSPHNISTSSVGHRPRWWLAVGGFLDVGTLFIANVRIAKKRLSAHDSESDDVGIDWQKLVKAWNGKPFRMGQCPNLGHPRSDQPETSQVLRHCKCFSSSTLWIPSNRLSSSCYKSGAIVHKQSCTYYLRHQTTTINILSSSPLVSDAPLTGGERSAGNENARGTGLQE